MGNLIVKDNALIEASHKLGEAEQRLILLAILKAREHCDSVVELKGKELIIHADDYVKAFGISQQMSYKALKQAVMGLFEAKWGYKYINDKGSKVVRYERFTQSAQYIEGEGTVSFKFADAIIPMLVELERSFTTYEIEQVANLSSRYAMRLYEMIMRHFDKAKGKGLLRIDLDELRFRLGLLPTEYAIMSDFKKRVFDVAIEQINKNTDLIVAYTQRKKGRVIVGFDIESKIKKAVKAKKPTERDSQTIDFFDNLTDKEREIIAQKKAYADEKGITDPLHRENLVKQALKQHKEAGEREQAEQERLEAERQAKLAKERAEKQAKAEQERLEKEQAEQRRALLATQFEALTPDEQAIVLAEVRKEISPVIIKWFDEAVQNDTAHKDVRFLSWFYRLFRL